jgi:hypothetical protein
MITDLHNTHQDRIDYFVKKPVLAPDYRSPESRDQ